MHQGILLQIGAGKIGRSFIGPLFARAGYRIVFVDNNERLVARLNHAKAYNVITQFGDGTRTTHEVGNVSGIHTADREAVVEAISEASIVCTAVGANHLHHVWPLLAAGLLARVHRGAGPLDILFAENARRISRQAAAALTPLLPAGFPLNDCCGLVDTSIGKMVPHMTDADLRRDPLQLIAEPYNTLIVDRCGFRAPIPRCRDLLAVDPIDAYVDRKLYLHNLGHAATAYLAHRVDPSLSYVWEAVADARIGPLVRDAMAESAEALLATYPNVFTASDLRSHIEELFERFANRALGDTLQRVGCDLARKLHRDERVVGPMLLAARHGRQIDRLVDVFYAALSFRICDAAACCWQEDIDLLEHYERYGVEWILTNITQLQIDDPLHECVRKSIMR